MQAASEQNWSDANQAYLAAALATVKARLMRRNGSAGERSAEPPRAAPYVGAPVFRNRPPALERVTEAFGLSRFERDLLLLCAGIELDPEIAAACAAAHGDPERLHPTFGLGLASLPEPHWSALSPASPLRRWRLVEIGAGAVMTNASLRIDERVLHYLAGVQQVDERLAAMLEPLPAVHPDTLVQSQSELAHRIAAAWSPFPPGRDAPIVQLCGAVADCRPIAAAAAGLLRLRAALLPIDLVPIGGADLDAFLRLWEREAALAGTGVLMLEADDQQLIESEAGRARDNAAMRLLERLEGFAIMRDREPRRIAFRPTTIVEVAHPRLEEQRQAWHEALGVGVSSDAADAVDAATSQFSLSGAAIRALGAEAMADAAATSSAQEASIGRTIWDLCRVRLRQPLEGLAQRIETGAEWDDLVLPETQKQTLRTIAAQLRQRVTVHECWGFAQKSRRGLGISALFWGQSGTGKTMAAEVLANELRLDLYRIDLASMVSKYIGETEKNLRRVFDAAEESGSILLFDEADALFGKRSEVKDSHDRYANIEVSYLLQRMEAYRGLAILTTNLRSALDPAFLRRLRFVVQFPFPDAVSREKIWSQVLPRETPREGIDAVRLSQLRIAGGNIRNIAMNAAFLAADAHQPLRMNHMLAAARSEYEKLDRPMTQAESEAWA